MKKQKQLGVRINKAIHYKIKYIARSEGRTLSRTIKWLIERRIDFFEKENGPIILPEHWD